MPLYGSRPLETHPHDIILSPATESLPANHSAINNGRELCRERAVLETKNFATYGTTYEDVVYSFERPGVMSEAPVAQQTRSSKFVAHFSRFAAIG